MITVKSYLYILCILVLAFLHVAGTVVAQEAQPQIESQLIADNLFPGEIPEVQITITAPDNGAIFVIKENRVYKRHALSLNMIASDGTRVVGGLPSTLAEKLPDDFVKLDMGKSMTMKFSVLSQLQLPGKYTIKMSFTPGPDDKVRYDKELAVTCQEIAPHTIRAKFSTEIAANIHPREGPEILELLNVKTGRGCELVYRSVHSHGVYWCSRLGPLDETSQIAAVFRTTSEKDSTWRQIWITYNKDNDIYFMRISGLGEILEKTLIQAKDEKKDK